MNDALRGIRAVSLCTLFPGPSRPQAGLFVRARLAALAKIVDLRIVAPERVFSPLVVLRASAVRMEPDPAWPDFGVARPRWFSLRGAGVLTPAVLYFQILPLFRRLKKLLAVDLIDAHFGFPDGVAAALLSRALGLPFVLTLRGSELLHARLRLRRRAMAWAVRRAGYVIAVSEELRRLALDLGVSPSRTKVIGNGIDPAVFHPQDRNTCRRKHGVASDAKVVLSVGHLIELKGHHRVVEAVTALRAEGQPVELLIVGGEPAAGVRSFRREIEQRIATLSIGDSVHLLGVLPPQTLAEYMAAADVLCLASDREGCPNVVQEALACGLPVVASRVGSVPEMLPDPELGSVVAPRDCSALAVAIRDALQRSWDRSKIAAWGQNRTWQNVAAEVAEVFQSVRFTSGSVSGCARQHGQPASMEERPSKVSKNEALMANVRQYP